MVFYGGLEDVVGTETVSLDGFGWEELAAWHLLERGSVKNIINALDGIFEAVFIADVADVESQLIVVVVKPHIVLFFLVSRKNTDLLDVGFEETFDDGVAE